MAPQQPESRSGSLVIGNATKSFFSVPTTMSSNCLERFFRRRPRNWGSATSTNSEKRSSLRPLSSCPARRLAKTSATCSWGLVSLLVEWRRKLRGPLS